MSTAGINQVNHVPIIYGGPFNIDEIKQAANGQSLVPGATHIREGVVVKPIHERHVYQIGRLILKLVSNAFLEKDSK